MAASKGQRQLTRKEKKSNDSVSEWQGNSKMPYTLSDIS